MRNPIDAKEEEQNPEITDIMRMLIVCRHGTQQ
jgi:hypothetical protein